MCFLNLVEIGWIRSLGNFDNSKYAKISNLVFPMNRNTKSCSIQFSEKDNLIIKSYSKFNLEENNYKVNNLPKLSKNLYLLQWFQCMATYKSEHDFHLTRSLTSLFRYHYRIKNKMFNAKNCWEVRRNYYKEHFTDFFYFGGCVAVVLERWKQLFYNPWQGHSSVLRLHCFYLSLALSPCFAHSLTLSLSLSLTMHCVSTINKQYGHLVTKSTSCVRGFAHLGKQKLVLRLHKAAPEWLQERHIAVSTTGNAS